MEETGFSKSESGEWAVVPPSLRKKLMEGAGAWDRGIGTMGIGQVWDGIRGLNGY